MSDTQGMQLNAGVALHLRQVIAAQMVPDATMAAALGISRDELAGLRRGDANGYPLARLMGFLTALGQDVEIHTRPHALAGEGGRITLTAILP